MNAVTPTDKPDTKPVQRRVSARVRQALELRLRQGKTWKEAAKAAGLSEAGIYKARQQPHVIELYENMKAQYIQDIETLKEPHHARALEVARDLLDNSKSDTVRARMVEFFRGETKQPSVNVAVQVNNQGGGGYEYVRPGQQVVEIRSDPAENGQSPASDAQNDDSTST